MTYHIHINGILQEVGFRPMVYQLAQEMQLNGVVKNGSDGLHVLFNAATQKAFLFFEKIKQQAPAQSKIISSDLHECNDIDFPDFPKNCSAEYENVFDKRFFSQTNSCDDCGGGLRIRDKNCSPLCSTIQKKFYHKSINLLPRGKL